MKLDDEGPSMWEVIASKPVKKGPKVRPRMYIHGKRDRDQEYVDAVLSLALKGVFNNDGSPKF